MKAILKIDGKEIIVTDFWYEDDDLIVVTESDDRYELKNPYLSSVKFEGLDYSASEICEIGITQTFSTNRPL